MERGVGIWGPSGLLTMDLATEVIRFEDLTAVWNQLWQGSFDRELLNTV